MAKRILVVDDDASFRGALRTVLAGRGYEVLEADDGRSALRRSDLGTVDLVITDIVMPEIEGTELIMRLRKEHPDLKILAVSGSPLAGPGKYLEIASRLGASSALLKPPHLQDLLKSVRDLIGEASSAT